MKYIRTKDGIIVDTTKYKNVVERTFNGKVVAIDLNHWGQDNDKYPTWIDVEDIVKQADTIEELCDEWVLPPQLNKPSYDTLNAKLFDFNSLKSCWAKAQKIIYGAIWTDKGLIYVAKMNDKGELELI